MTTTTATSQVICHKCYGAKVFQRLTHIAAGVCFTCRGTGVVEQRAFATDSSTTVAACVPPAGEYTVGGEHPEAGRFTVGAFDTFEAAAAHRDEMRKGNQNCRYVVLKVVNGKTTERNGTIWH